MLFIFSGDEIHSFWMKNTKIPLDLLWLDEDGRIIFLLEDVPPCLEDPCPSYGSMQKARYVLELKAGMCKLENLGPGSRLVLPGNI